MAKKKRNKKYAGRDAAQGTVIKKFAVDDSFHWRDWVKEYRLQIVSWVIKVVLFSATAGIAWLVYSLIF